MINSQINYDLTPGSIVNPVYAWNAKINSGKLDILEKDGTIVSGHYTSAGDQIIVLNVYTSENMALIQYPTPEGYRQGYVENTLLNEVASYRFRNWWQNGGTSQAVLQNDGSPLTTLPAYSPATILFINDGYTCIAYGDGNGMPNQSGFSVYGGLFGGVNPLTSRDYPANGETTAERISILDYNGDPLTGRVTTKGDQITILNILKNGELALIEYPVSGGYRKGFIKNYEQSQFVFNNWDNFTNNTNQSITVYNTPQLTGALNTIGSGKKATILFKTNSGDLCIAYNTSGGLHIGSGYISANDASGSVNPFRVGDEVEILEDAVWFATGPVVGDRKNDIFIVMEKIDINGGLAYTIKDCRTNELFNVYPVDIEETKERPAISPIHSNNGTHTDGSSSSDNRHSGPAQSTGGDSSNTNRGGSQSVGGNTSGNDSGLPVSGNTNSGNESGNSASGNRTDGSSTNNGGGISGTSDGERDINLSGTININVNNEEMQEKFTKQINSLEIDFDNKIDNLGNQISIENTNIDSVKTGLTTVQTAVNANTKSVESIKVDIAGVQKEIRPIKTGISSNTQAIDQLQTKVSQIKPITGLIGGVNVIDSSPSHFGPKGSTSSEYGFNWAGVMLEAGKTYTLTVCGCSTEQAIQNGQFCAIEIFNGDWSVYYEVEIKETTPTTKQITFTVAKTEKFAILTYPMPSKAKSENVTVYWYNVQEGQIGTAWVPSLYDLNIKSGEVF